MSRAPKGADVPWSLTYFLGKQLDKIRMRNAFADARRAQAARMLAQQIGPNFDYWWDRMLARQDRNAAIWPLIEDSSVYVESKAPHDENHPRLKKSISVSELTLLQTPLTKFFSTV